MNIMKKTHNSQKDSAVSPVIGVMLMLVVTIVIAAFVATFAGGLFSTSEAAPVASIDVKILYNSGYTGNDCVMYIENLGGDSIPTSDLRILTYYTSKTGSAAGTIKGDRTAMNTKTVTVTNSTGATDQKIVAPILLNAAYGDAATDNTAINFGNYNFAPGTIMSTYSNEGTAYILMGQTSSANQLKYLNKYDGDTINDGYTDFGIGSNVHVEILHTPSNSVLYSKDVIVA